MHPLSAMIIAFATYSRIPMPRTEWSDENRKYAFCFFPMIGICIGLSLALWLWLCEAKSIGPMLKGCIAAALPLLITGGIHMDGFIDTCDALASWQTPEKRLEILKDSHVGAFAVIRCCTYLLLSAGLYSECPLRYALPVSACFVLSRALSAFLSVSMPQARTHGMLSGFANAAAGNAVRLSCCLYGLACLITLLCTLGPIALFPLLLTTLTAVFFRRMALQSFGGITGDLAGWFLQITELVSLAGIILGGKIL